MTGVKSEAGVNPALCLSNRDICERIGVKSQATKEESLGRHPGRERIKSVDLVPVN